MRSRISAVTRVRAQQSSSSSTFFVRSGAGSLRCVKFALYRVFALNSVELSLPDMFSRESSCARENDLITRTPLPPPNWSVNPGIGADTQSPECPAAPKPVFRADSRHFLSIRACLFGTGCSRVGLTPTFSVPKLLNVGSQTHFGVELCPGAALKRGCTQLSLRTNRMRSQKTGRTNFILEQLLGNEI
jgi:hypothetical protein